MTRSHDELRDALGAYVLGQLDADLRTEIEGHLGGCECCRADLDEISPVALALRGIDPDVVLPEAVAPPAELDERIRRALGAPVGGVRRWVPFSGAVLAAAAAAALVTAIVVRDAPSSPPVVAVPRVEVVEGVTASAGLVDHTWGLEIKLRASGLPVGERFEMWVVGQDGTTYEAGEFIGVAAGTTIACDMPSSVMLDDAASFRVVDASGDAVISASLPS